MKDLIDYSITILSTMWSVENINEVLGIILLILSIINILWKSFIQIKHKIENKKFDEIGNVLEETIEDIKELKKEE